MAQPPRTRNRSAGPANQSRAAGAPAPASAAATAPRPAAGSSFYNADGAAPAQGSAPPIAATSPLQHFAPEQHIQQHAEAVQYQAVQGFEQDTLDADLHPDMAQAGHDETLESVIARIRQLRRPLGEWTQKLALPKRRGYHRHWFNDTGDRVNAAKNNGWAHVSDAEGKPTKRAVGHGREGGVLYAYAMEIPEVFWREDMDARHREAQSRVDGIRNNVASDAKGEATRADQGKFYNPSSAAMPTQIIGPNG